MLYHVEGLRQETHRRQSVESSNTTRDPKFKAKRFIDLVQLLVMLSSTHCCQNHPNTSWVGIQLADGHPTSRRGQAQSLRQLTPEAPRRRSCVLSSCHHFFEEPYLSKYEPPAIPELSISPFAVVFLKYHVGPAFAPSPGRNSSARDCLPSSFVKLLPFS